MSSKKSGLFKITNGDTTILEFYQQSGEIKIALNGVVQTSPAIDMSFEPDWSCLHFM